MSRKFNLFQRMMLGWRELYPYNAVHVAIVSQALDRARLSGAIAQQLEFLGLTQFRLDRSRLRYEWLGGRQEVELRVLTSDEPTTLLDAEIVRQLNAAFPKDGRIDPFRFFAVDVGSSFYLGLAYDHIVAGGDSIVRLLRGIVGRYRGEPATPGAIDVAVAPSYGRLFLRQAGALVLGLGSLSGIAASCRRSFRAEYTAIEDGRNAFVRLRLGPPQQEALVRAAKAWGVTQNDMFMSILLKVVSPLRRDFGSDAQSAFVPLLASFRVSHPVPDGIGLEELARSVHTESKRIRQGKLYLQTLLALGLAAFEWRYLSERRQQRLFAKHYPVWVGTTPLNAGALWATSGTAGAEAAPEYLRAVSTGPLAPMICAISTTDQAVNVGISYRTAAFDRDTVDGVVANMLLYIKNL